MSVSMSDEAWEELTYGSEYDRHGVEVTVRLLECPVCASAVVADHWQRHAESHPATHPQPEE